MVTCVKNIMTNHIITVPYGTSLFEASELMKEKRIRHLPIRDNDTGVVGILSQRDLQYVPDSKNLSVELFMSSPVEFVDQEVSVQHAIFKMLETKISCLLVIGSGNEVMGILTTDDLLWHLAHLLSAQKESHLPSVLNALNAQTAGEVLNQIASTGV